MPCDLLIDGYNLMHAAGLARRRYARGELERSRLGLLNLIASLLPEDQRRRTTIVFDAKCAPPDATRQGAHREMWIVFAGPEDEADDEIEELIRVHSSPKNLLVVSSDRRLQKAAGRRRAQSQDSELFLEECERRLRRFAGPAAAADPKPGSQLSTVALDEWLAVFGDVDPTVLRAEAGGVAPVAPIGKFVVRSAAVDAEHEEPAHAEPEPGDELTFWEQRLAELLRPERTEES